MIRVLAIALQLRRLREAHPALFDGAEALAAINACIAEYTAGSQPRRAAELSNPGGERSTARRGGL
jgi:hypothetical protein